MRNARNIVGGKAGFSLIELLVTIAIIAVLIGILLPALGPARDSARRVACAAQLSSLGDAIELYKSDHNETFPLARYMPRPWLSGFDGLRGSGAADDELAIPALPEVMTAYFDANSGAWVCPGDRVVAETTFIDENGVERESGASYSYVTALAGQTFEQSFFARFLFMSPSDAPVANDFDGGTFETTEGDEVFVDFFHRTRNMLFVDSHVGRYESPGPRPSAGEGGGNG